MLLLEPDRLARDVGIVCPLHQRALLERVAAFVAPLDVETEGGAEADAAAGADEAAADAAAAAAAADAAATTAAASPTRYRLSRGASAAFKDAPALWTGVSSCDSSPGADDDAAPQRQKSTTAATLRREASVADISAALAEARCGGAADGAWGAH